MDSPLDLVAFLTRSENRVETLLALADGPATRPDLQDETGVARATLSRILADFRRHDLATRDAHEYAATPLGELLAAGLTSPSSRSSQAPARP
jgi:predicted transcriptional regulator